MKKLMIVIFAITMIVAILPACGSQSSPERTVDKYFSAVKTGDLDKAIECFTPAMQAQYEAAMSFSDTLFGLFGISTDSDAILGGIVGMANTDAYKNYNFKVSGSTKTDSDHATVSVDVYIDGEKTSTTMVYCVKIDGEWYIEE